MVSDAHVHVGYYPKIGCLRPQYYSPRRIVGVLNRCGVGHFIVSSTCAQIDGIKIKDIMREACEIKRLAEERAHIFFWLSGHLYDEDRKLSWMETGLFEGVKFHEGETQWMQRRKKDLVEIVDSAAKRGYKVQFHCDGSEGCKASQLEEVARMFPSIHFDFAHCRPMCDLARIVSECENVWTDTAYMGIESMSKLPDYDWHGRLMFGTDLPVWQAKENVNLTRRYRSMLAKFNDTGLRGSSDDAFMSYLNI